MYFLYVLCLRTFNCLFSDVSKTILHKILKFAGNTVFFLSREQYPDFLKKITNQNKFDFFYRISNFFGATDGLFSFLETINEITLFHSILNRFWSTKKCSMTPYYEKNNVLIFYENTEILSKKEF